MRIWIDLTNSPHVNFFSEMIEEIRNDHEVLLTCRPLANTIDLLKLKGFDYHIIGSHYGANKVKKSIGFPIRVMQLYSFLKNKGIDVAISHSSFYSPVVARLLGIRSIYLNDNEHALGNRISFLCASTIMIPEFLSTELVRRQWGNPQKVVQYPGVKEAIYLSGLDGCVRNKYSKESDTNEIFIRPEPWTAQYYRGEKNFIDNLIINLKNKYKIILMPRGKEQAEHYGQVKFQGITIPPKPLTLEEMVSRCLLFIGAGGTMTREAAILGIPTISIYQSDLLEVDRYLIDEGYMSHKKNLTAEFVVDFLDRHSRIHPSTELFDKGRKAYKLIMEKLLSNK
jgi:predicted glycosyltransferase